MRQAYQVRPCYSIIKPATFCWFMTTAISKTLGHSRQHSTSLLGTRNENTDCHDSNAVRRQRRGAANRWNGCWPNKITAQESHASSGATADFWNKTDDNSR